MEKCDHIVGYRDDRVDDYYAVKDVVIESDGFNHEEINFKFTYCPICGIKLEK
jgi:hypothetical protein